MFGHFVSNMLMLGHAGVQAPRRDIRYRMFHVEHFWLSYSDLKFSITFLENNSQTPLPYKNHKIIVDNILINVEMLLRRELRKACLHAFHNRADQHSACAKIVKVRVASVKTQIKNPPYLGRKLIYKTLDYYCCLRRNMKKVTVLLSNPLSIYILVSAIIPFFIPAS